MTSGLAAGVAAYGLDSRRPLPGEPLPHEQFAALLATSERQGILGLLAESVRDSALPVSAEQRAELEAAFRASLTRDLRTEAVLLAALDALAGAGIASRVVGGADLAHTAYPRPELRVLGEIEVLVPRGRGADARAVARAEFGATDGAHGLAILEAPRRGAEADDLFAPPYRFPLAGFELAALPMPQRLLRAAGAVKHPEGEDAAPSLGALRDVAQLVLRERPHLVDVLLMARSWGCEPALAHAVAAAWRELELVPEPPIARWAAR